MPVDAERLSDDDGDGTHADAVPVREASPLRLAPAADELGSPSRAARPATAADDRGRRRRWWSWGAPLTAAAVVIALAIALVIAKGMPNDGAVPRKRSLAPPARMAPGYYVALKEAERTSTTITDTQPAS